MSEIRENPEFLMDESLYSVDAFLGGRLSLFQPRKGYRAGTDAVLLASAVEAGEGESILDVGAGVGTAGLCALVRNPGAHLYGIELQKELATLAIENAGANGMADRSRFIAADITDRTALRGVAGPGGKPLLEAGFDHVITNPPYYDPARSQMAGTEIKTIAHVEGSAPLGDWLRFCLARTKSKGRVTVIHRADRLGDLLAVLSPGCGAISVVPIWPDDRTPAKRVIVTGIKGARGPLTLSRGLVMHGPDGARTGAAERISREGASLHDLIE